MASPRLVTLGTTIVAVWVGLLGGIVRADDPVVSGHWAFRPVRRPIAPTVRRADLVTSPVDAFILEKLQTVGLEPSAIADKRTLIRRASYDLLGLPPTPSEVADFLADDSPEAFATLIDRLLASPHYGERWGRYWLDVARFANTRGDTGTDDNVNPFAFTYRDYVVRAIGNDLPFDRFLTEQIAADRLGLPENSPALAALGFITVGRHFRSNNHDTIDDRIDVVTRGTMALTVSCARCHDHKYDPIPTKDYYSLYGVFASSSEPAQLPIVGDPDPDLFARYRAEHQRFESRRADVISRQESELLAQHRKLTAELLLATRQSADEVRSEPMEGEAADAPLRGAGTKRWRSILEKLDTAGDPVFAPWFAFAAIPPADFAAEARIVATKASTGGLPHRVNPIVAQAFGGEPPQSLSDVAGRYSRLLNDLLANPAPTDPDPNREELRKALLGENGPGTMPADTLRKLFPQNVQGQIQQIGNELARLEAEHPGAPVRAMALVDNPHPQNARVFLRGNPNNMGDEVPRQFLEVLAGAGRQPFSAGSGRLDLARAITGRDNPLTARVIVNRVWMHHFGEGLVTTPDDFGVRADSPSHPELLDFLASRFMDDGWSLKNLHRLIMLSRTWRQVSDDGGRSETIDPENRWLSKMNRRRLDFESMRDTLLAVAGDLDATVGGRAVELVPQPRVSAGGAFFGPAKEQPPTLRRAVYAFIDRQNLPGLLRIFDFADPDAVTGRRYVTTVPQQALFFLNNPFVMRQARSLTNRPEFLRRRTPEDRARDLYQQVLQREPAAEEIELAVQFVVAAGKEAVDSASPSAPGPQTRAPDKEPRLLPWEQFAHVLLMSDELVFVD